MEIVITHARGAAPVTVFHVRGDINSTTYAELQARAQQAVERGAECIVLDLAEVPYVSSAGLRVINYLFHAMRTDAVEDSDAAMTYYYDHRAEIDRSLEDDEAFAEAFRRNNPSLLQTKLKALGHA